MHRGLAAEPRLCRGRLFDRLGLGRRRAHPVRNWPDPRSRKLLQRAGLGVSDIDLIELNEAFASSTLAVIRELKLDEAKVNVNGGAIALGHPVGATGIILVVKLLSELRRRGLERGIVTMCVGSGQGMALLLEAA